MPNPSPTASVTPEERARLRNDAINWLDSYGKAQDRPWFFLIRDLLKDDAEALARAADDARDARRYRYVRDANIRDYDVLCEPRSNYLRMSAALDESIDAALASQPAAADK